MKLNLPSFFTLLFIAFSACLLPSIGSAQGLKIAVVDMQEALNQYFKTTIEVEKINALAEEKRANIDERTAAYQKMTSQMTELDKKVKDAALAQQAREDALQQLNALAQERAAKGKEIQDAQRKASAEIMAARQEMEATLVGEIREALDSIVAAEQLDLVFDKSFLPKANKAILHTSENVRDLTGDVVASLNANAPGSN